jgi:hypothetical protein
MRWAQASRPPWLGLSAALVLLGRVGCRRPGAAPPSPSAAQAPREVAFDAGAYRSVEQNPSTASSDVAAGASSANDGDTDAGRATRDDTALRESMTAQVYRDQDYRRYVCGDTPCAQPDFEDGLEFRREVLKENPEILGDFLEPARKGENDYAGFFVARGEQPKIQFLFFGMDLRSIAGGGDDGYRLVSGTERRGPGTWVDTLFRWNGTYYQQFRSSRRSYPP